MYKLKPVEHTVLQNLMEYLPFTYKNSPQVDDALSPSDWRPECSVGSCCHIIIVILADLDLVL